MHNYSPSPYTVRLAFYDRFRTVTVKQLVCLDPAEQTNRSGVIGARRDKNYTEKRDIPNT